MNFIFFIVLSIVPTFIFAQTNDLGVKWNNFYYKEDKILNPIKLEDHNVCVKYILEAQEKYKIPNNLLLAISIQESGRRTEDGILTSWPWTINSSGTGRWFKTKDEAIEWLNLRKSEGINSNDIGCMQINLRWHPNAFNTIEDGFNPEINVDYSARLLRDLYDNAGDWWEAAGRYHSFTQEKKDIYLNNLKKNILFANSTFNYFENLAFSEDSNSKKTGSSIIWSSWLTEKINDNEGTFSIYSNEELKPILPLLDK